MAAARGGLQKRPASRRGAKPGARSRIRKRPFLARRKRRLLLPTALRLQVESGTGWPVTSAKSQIVQSGPQPVAVLPTAYRRLPTAFSPPQPLDTGCGRGIGFTHANAHGPTPGRSGALLSSQARSSRTAARPIPRCGCGLRRRRPKRPWAAWFPTPVTCIPARWRGQCFSGCRRARLTSSFVPITPDAARPWRSCPKASG